MRNRRHTMRLHGYDYTHNGLYFITICVNRHQDILGEIIDNKMVLNIFGQIVEYQWEKIPKHFKNAQLDVFQIMPDHLHGIIVLTNKNKCDDGIVGAKHSEMGFYNKIVILPENASPQQHPIGTKPGSISSIMQNFSSVSTRKINHIPKSPGSKLWQRGYYDRIIRGNEELIAIRKYIINNPVNWQK